MRRSCEVLLAATVGLLLAGGGPWSVVWAQQQTQQRPRPPVRVRVNPVNPGPNAVRQCRFWLAQENRPSGTVIVPREQCWWEPG